MSTLVRDVMTSPVVTIELDRPAQEAARMMRDMDTGDVIVTDNGRLMGIITDRDLAVRLVAQGLELDTPVSRVCTEAPCTVSPDENTRKATELMRERAVRRLPVCEGDQVVGVVSIGDLAKELDQRSVLADISAAPPND
jgi:CBS domain-containing protein